MKNEKIILREKLPAIDSRKCARCGRCIEICPHEAILEPLNTSCAKCIKYCISMEIPCSPEYNIFNYELCDSCGSCVSSCPQDAMYWIAGATNFAVSPGPSAAGINTMGNGR